MGKARTAQNANKGEEWKAEREKVRDLQKTLGRPLREQRELLRLAR
jgi:hypothetical protein